MNRSTKRDNTLYRNFAFMLDGKHRIIVVRTEPFTVEEMERHLIDKFGAERVARIEPSNPAGGGKDDANGQ